MKKFLFAVVMAVILVSGLLAACASPAPTPAPAPTPTPAPSPAPAPAPSPAPAPAQPAEVIKWRCQQGDSAASLQVQSLNRVSAAIEAASSGRLVIDVFPGGAIVPADEEFTSVHDGIIDMTVQGCGDWTSIFPQADLFAFMPGGMSSMETLFWNLEGGGLDLVNEMLDGYFTVLPGRLTPPEAFLSSTKPIKTVADINGLRIRTPGGSVDGVAFARMGAAIVNLPGSELYEALQRGVVDTFQYSNPATDLAVSFYEVIDYYYLSPVRQPTDFAYYAVNNDSWAALPDDLKILVQQSFLWEGITNYARMTSGDAEAIKFYKDYGVTVEPMSVELEVAIIETAEEIYDERAAVDTLVAKIIESNRSYMKTLRESYPRL